MQKKKNHIPKPTYFGTNLKFLRRINGHSQKNLAQQLGINRNHIASYESGVVEPNAKIFLKACEYFQIEPVDMMSSILEDEGVDTAIGLDYDNLNTVDKFFNDQLEAFVSQTNEITKVLEGYIALERIDLAKKDSDQSSELMTSYKDLIELLKTLITTNWEFIQKVLPSRSLNEEE